MHILTTGRYVRPLTAALVSLFLALLIAGPVLAKPKAILVAGDIAAGTMTSQEAATAALIERRSGLVMTAGDNVQQDGTYQEFLAYYHPTWGQFKGRTRPTPGNHDYDTPGAVGYFRYFGERGGPHERGYYTLKVGGWRVFALNSDACKVGCGPGNAQYTWLKARLAESRDRCTLAVWHHPRFSSGFHGDDPMVAPLVRLLYKHGAEIIVNGHDHDYERLAPARPSGEVDAKFGIRQFIVGTGGAEMRGEGAQAAAHSRVFQSTDWGVLKLTLEGGSYSWRFLPIAGQTFEDQGDGTCHGKPG